MTTTRERLVRAAEPLLAARGLEAVSLREIGRAAGARNIAAAQYHFSDRSGLVAAILDKHVPGISLARHRVLDDYERRPPRRDPLATLVHALVAPTAEKLYDPDGGRDFLRIYAQLLARPEGIGLPLVPGARNSIRRWGALVAPLLSDPSDPLCRRATAVRVSALELAGRALVDDGDHDAFVANLVDVLTGVLLAPVSPKTRRLTRGRRESAWPPDDEMRPSSA